MDRKAFLTVASLIAMAVGLFALTLPQVLLVNVKVALPNEAAYVMARTVGVLLLSVGVLGFLVRGHANSPTLRAVLLANLLLQLCILPIDPLAWLQGTFTTLGSFLPNTVIHLLLAAGFGYHLVNAQRTAE